MARSRHTAPSSASPTPRPRQALVRRHRPDPAGAVHRVAGEADGAAAGLEGAVAAAGGQRPRHLVDPVRERRRRRRRARRRHRASRRSCGGPRCRPAPGPGTTSGTSGCGSSSPARSRRPRTGRPRRRGRRRRRRATGSGARRRRSARRRRRGREAMRAPRRAAPHRRRAVAPTGRRRRTVTNPTAAAHRHADRAGAVVGTPSTAPSGSSNSVARSSSADRGSSGSAAASSVGELLRRHARRAGRHRFARRPPLVAAEHRQQVHEAPGAADDLRAAPHERLVEGQRCPAAWPGRRPTAGPRPGRLVLREPLRRRPTPLDRRASSKRHARSALGPSGPPVTTVDTVAVAPGRSGSVDAASAKAATHASEQSSSGRRRQAPASTLARMPSNSRSRAARPGTFERARWYSSNGCTVRATSSGRANQNGEAGSIWVPWASSAALRRSHTEEMSTLVVTRKSCHGRWNHESS